MLKAYKYRLKLTDNQKIYFMKSFGCCRFVYNYMLRFCTNSYEQEKKSFSAYDLMKLLPALKQEFEWLQEPANQCLQKAIFNLSVAFKNFFRNVRKGAKPGYPRFKKKGMNDSCKFDLNIHFDAENKRIKIPKIGWIRLFLDRTPKGILKSITISKTPTGKYFASCLFETGDQIPDKHPVEKDSAIGIDLGIKDFIITSKGDKISNPKYYQLADKRIRRLQRIKSRKVNGSNRNKLIQLKINNLYERKTNLITNFLHHVSNQLLRENQTIVVEDLNVRGMMRNHKLAHSIAEVCWSKFLSILTYKAEWLGKNVLKIGRFEPSSKQCSCCGYKKDDLTLSDRKWICPSCGTSHDRDINAARNILNFGLTTYSPLV